ncbi:MAG: DegQ family serine endoprotease [Candidatus Brocadiia bacterium]
MSKRLPFAVLIACLLAAGIIFSGILTTPSPPPAAAQQGSAVAEKSSEAAELDTAELAEFAGKLENIFQHAAEKVQPAVVAVKTTKIVRAPQLDFGDPFLERFFGQMPQREQRRPGLGSGMILDKEGHILTNNHVIRDVDELTVSLADGREFDAEVIGTDEKTDLAVIGLTDEVSDLPHVEFADSDSLRIGQWVLAIGNPFGLTHTVSAGIVSATGRTGMGVAEYESMIQTDAAINPGNSGGPLVNLEGKVVGINTAIFSRTGGSLGIGFAIPSNMAVPILDDLKAGREVVRGHLGVYIAELTADMAEMFGLEDTRGVLIQEVQDGSPAAEAGFKAGDVILTYNGEQVTKPGHLQRLVTVTDPGTRVAIELWRDGETLTERVRIGRLEDQAVSDDWLGMQVQPLTQEQAARLDRPDLRGMAVTEVAPRSPAARAGIRPGDVIISINRKQVSSASEYTEQLSAAQRQGRVLLRFLDVSTGRTRFVLLRR